MKKLVCVLLSLVTMISMVIPTQATEWKEVKAKNPKLQKYRSICSRYETEHNIRATDSALLNKDILRNRLDTVLVERVISRANGKNKFARIINCGHKKEFIKTKRKEKKGTIIVSYLVYNPNTTYIDDVIARFDRIIKK
jgi:hypothetical protein